jgi:hypothetical protein
MNGQGVCMMRVGASFYTRRRPALDAYTVGVVGRAIGENEDRKAHVPMCAPCRTTHGLPRWKRASNSEIEYEQGNGNAR